MMTDAPRPADDLACTEEVELMTDYLEGALPAAEAQRFERHLETCPGCTEYLEQMRTLAGSLGGLPEESLPAELRDGLIDAFRDLRASVRNARRRRRNCEVRDFDQSEIAQTAQPQRATRREWIGLAVIALPCLLYAMDLTVLTLAVPSLSADLQPEQHRAALDRRHLRLPRRRLPDHDGDARRPDRPPPAAPDRRRARSAPPRSLAAFAPSPRC